jgi:thiamine transport system ATP-binding protein
MLQVDQVRFQRGNTKFGYDFSLKQGEILAVLGSSGSGKSTLADLIAGFEHPISGDILIDSQSVLQLPPNKRKVSYVFQSNNLFSHLTVLENLALAFRPSGKISKEEKTQIVESLKKVSLEDYSHRLPNDLSIGQQQRVALARAALRDSHVLVLDEPFSALDPGLRIQLGEWIQKLVPQFSMACLLITHHPDEALRLSEKTIFIDHGQQISYDDTKKVLSSSHSAIKQFIGN